MKLDQLQLLRIQVVLGAIYLVRAYAGGQMRQKSCVYELEFLAQPANSDHYWIAGKELLDDGQFRSIGGDIICCKGGDGLWLHGRVLGSVYLELAGKCPFTGEYFQGRGMEITVSKDAGYYTYSYLTVGKFRI